jgi:hypothetical protein
MFFHDRVKSKNGNRENQERTFAKTDAESQWLHRNPERKASKRTCLRLPVLFRTQTGRCFSSQGIGKDVKDGACLCRCTAQQTGNPTGIRR